ncbi:proteasome-interacting protein cic1 [Malassezia sp. CBS 17886]|nr:proteasome-interacting protein cic1 [Malassezia sp. CBS 17886]
MPPTATPVSGKREKTHTAQKATTVKKAQADGASVKQRAAGTAGTGAGKSRPRSPSETGTAAPSGAASAQPKIAEKVDIAQVLKACKALAAFVERRRAESKKNELPLDGDGSLGAAKDAENTVWLQITVKQLNPERKVKPVRIPLAYHLLDEQASVCLLTKDPQREYKDLLHEKGIRSVNRVVGVEKLKGKFRPFDARRALVREHDLFLADERIVPLLPKLCGSVFYQDRKFPVPVDLVHRKRLPHTIERAIASTYYMQNKGSCSTIRVGFLHRHSPEALVENIAAALPAVVSRVPGKWRNIQNIELKTGYSAALPVWNCSLTDGDEDARWSMADAHASSAGTKRKLAPPPAPDAADDKHVRGKRALGKNAVAKTART